MRIKKKKWRVAYDFTTEGTIVVPADNAEQAKKIVETMIYTGKLGLPRRKEEENNCFHIGEEPEIVSDDSQ